MVIFFANDGEKHETAADAGAELEGCPLSVVTVTVAGGYRTRLVSLTAITRMAKSAKLLRLRMCGRLYVENTLVERLPQDLQHQDGAKDLLKLAASVAAGPDIRDVSPGEAWLTMTHRQAIPL